MNRPAGDQVVHEGRQARWTFSAGCGRCFPFACSIESYEVRSVSRLSARMSNVWSPAVSVARVF